MGLKSLFSVLFLFSFLVLGAQNSNSQTDSISKSEYIQSFPEKFTARLFYVNTSNSFELSNRNTAESISLVPNKQDKIGSKVSYRGLSLSYSFAPDFLAENKDNEGSRLFNINLRSYFGKWMQTLDIYSEKGFYVKDDLNETYLPKTKSFKIGGSTGYIFNENFSFRAITNQDEKQVNSAGSFIPQLIYYYTNYRIRAEGEGDLEVDEKYHSTDVAINPGYYYNWVPTENLLLSAGASAGIGANFSGGSNAESLTSLLYDFNFRGALLYDFSDFYAGAQYSYLILNHNSDRSTYTEDNIPYFQAFIGYRFDAPQRVKDFSDNINDTIDSIKN